MRRFDRQHPRFMLVWCQTSSCKKGKETFVAVLFLPIFSCEIEVLQSIVHIKKKRDQFFKQSTEQKYKSGEMRYIFGSLDPFVHASTRKWTAFMHCIN